VIGKRESTSGGKGQKELKRWETWEVDPKLPKKNNRMTNKKREGEGKKEKMGTTVLRHSSERVGIEEGEKYERSPKVTDKRGGKSDDTDHQNSNSYASIKTFCRKLVQRGRGGKKERGEGEAGQGKKNNAR